MEEQMTQWEEPSSETGNTGLLREELPVYATPSVAQLTDKKIQAGRIWDKSNAKLIIHHR